MTQAKPRFKTLEEYAALDPSELPEGHYEVVNGEIIELPTESDINLLIATFLTVVFAQQCPYYLIRRGTEVFVSSRAVTSRYPDLVVLSEEGRAAIRGASRSAITLEMPPPRLVIEVVSPGKPGSDNYDRDYVEKPREYAARGIQEFWQIDPSRSMVNVLELVDGVYRSQAFRGSDRVISPTFPELELTAAQILSGEI
jgi:Uma2 family endonuclease